MDENEVIRNLASLLITSIEEVLKQQQTDTIKVETVKKLIEMYRHEEYAAMEFRC